MIPIQFQIPEFVLFILNGLKRAGHQAFIVGGALRDAFLEKPVTDWDIATTARVGEIRKIFHDTPHFFLKHETVTLVHSARPFEITTFKGNTLEADLAHRDFTMNAMALDPDQEKIYDPCQGGRDLSSRVVRAVGDPIARFTEDPLRTLRAARLACQLGFQIEKETWRAVKVMATRIRDIAPERIREELLKLLLSEKPSSGLSLMRRSGLLAEILPELLEGYKKRQESDHRFTLFKHLVKTADHIEPQPGLRIAALLHDVAKPRVRKKRQEGWIFPGHEEASAEVAGDILARLRFSKKMLEKVTNLVRHHSIQNISPWTDAAVRRLIRRVGIEDTRELLRLVRADLKARGPELTRLQPLEDLEGKVKKQLAGGLALSTGDLAIGGRDVMAVLGLSQGEEVGKVLDQLLEEVTDHPEQNTREGLLSRLGQMKGH